MSLYSFFFFLVGENLSGKLKEYCILRTKKCHHMFFIFFSALVGQNLSLPLRHPELRN